MSYKQRYLLFFTLDSLIIISSIFMSYWIVHPNIPTFGDHVILISAGAIFISHHLVASVMHLYDRLWNYASVRELLIIISSVTISVGVASLLQQWINNDIYMRIMAVTWMLHIIMIGGSRFLFRVFNDRESFKSQIESKRILIVGAGQAGTMLAKQLQTGQQLDVQAVGFIDDDPNKRSLRISGMAVLGTTDDIVHVVKKHRVEEVIIAIPSLSKREIHWIYERCIQAAVKIKVMPSIEDVMLGKLNVSEMRAVEINDLLGREEVKLDMLAISKKLTGKTILVTGAGGSIGSEICRQVMKFQPKKLILVGQGENSIYKIHMELTNVFPGVEIIPVIANVQDRDRIYEVINNYKPAVVYHAAAHKHVPLMEYNPREAFKNNVLGTKNVAEAAHAAQVDKFVLVSTDKAVNPPNVMGATKRLAEMIIQDLAMRSKTVFAAVRFGNVLGSRGSVVPLFQRQIVAGGPVTVTDPEMTRYFMTIPEASRLVIQAGALARGGELFVLDMGEPVKIVDLAKNLIELSGYKISEVPIKFTGLRPGEKMHEEILSANETGDKVFEKITLVRNSFMIEGLDQYLNILVEIQEDEIFKETLINLANNKVLV